MFKRSTVIAKPAFVFLAALAPALAVAQEADDNRLEEIVVTGTLLSGENIADSQPVAVFTAEDIAASGAVTIQDFLLRQPFVTGQKVL